MRWKRDVNSVNKILLHPTMLGSPKGREGKRTPWSPFHVPPPILAAPPARFCACFRRCAGAKVNDVDIHKKMLAVVVADVEVEGEYQFERRTFGSTPEHLQLLSGWLVEQGVEEAVMESTAQYWQPVWGAL